MVINEQIEREASQILTAQTPSLSLVGTIEIKEPWGNTKIYRVNAKGRIFYDDQLKRPVKCGLGHFMSITKGNKTIECMRCDIEIEGIYKDA